MPLTDYFTNNYDHLMQTAMKITSSNREVSEDLLHDVFIRCSKIKRLPMQEQEFQRYIYRSIKNGYISFLRRESRSIPIDPMQADLASHLDLVMDPRTNARLNDEIFAICFYACERKKSSIAASILILRFIHGFFSNEVAKLLNRSKNAIEGRMALARREMALLSCIPADDQINRSHSKFLFGRRIGPSGFESDVVNDLRQYVFALKSGRCFSAKDFKRIYRQDSRRPEREEASHLVSCRDCLEEAGRLLRLPSLDSRHPLDALGVQTVVERMHVSGFASMVLLIAAFGCEQGVLFI